MATEMLNEPSLAGGDRHILRETAPSDLRTNEPWVARIVGAVGFVLVLFGLFLALRTAFAGPALVPGWLVMPSIALGLMLVLYHTVHDGHVLAYRGYLLLAGVFLLVALGSLLLRGPVPGRTGDVVLVFAFYFSTWGTFFVALALAFALTAARHEEDESIRLLAGLALMGVGALFALLGFGGGVLYTPPPTDAARDFFIQPGALLAFIGLMAACGGMSLIDTNSPLGYRAALGVGILGALVVLYAAGRVLVPMVLHAAGAMPEAPKPYLAPYGLLLLGLGMAYVLASAAFISDNPVLVIARREMNAFYYQPIAWIVLAGMAVFGWFQFIPFFVRVMAYSQNIRLGGGMPEPIVAAYFLDWNPVYAVMIAVPFLTMRLFSEESRSGTLEMLLTVPISETTLVLGKFLAGLCMFLLTCAPWAVYLVGMRLEVDKPFDYYPLLAFAVVLVATGAAFISVGGFFSSLTRDQIIAFVLTLIPMVLSLSLFLVARESIVPINLRDPLKRMSFVHLWIEAMNGKLWIRDVVFNLSMTVFWLFLTVKVLESRKWR